MQAYEYINQPKRLDDLIEKSREKERELWAMATSATQNNDGMPHAHGGTDKIANIVHKLSIAQKMTSDLIDQYVDTKQDIINHLGMLPAKQRIVLCWLYIEKREKRKKGQGWYYTWAEISEILGCTEQNIANTRRRAIKNLQKILDTEKNSEKTIDV